MNMNEIWYDDDCDDDDDDEDDEDDDEDDDDDDDGHVRRHENLNLTTYVSLFQTRSPELRAAALAEGLYNLLKSYWNTTGILLESCRNSELELCWSPAGILLEFCWNPAGVFLEACQKLVVVLLESCCWSSTVIFLWL